MAGDAEKDKIIDFLSYLQRKLAALKALERQERVNERMEECALNQSLRSSHGKTY